MSAITGDFNKLKIMRQRLGALRDPATHMRLAKVMGEAAQKSLMDGFAKSKDPYGAAWKPLAKNRARNVKAKGSSKPLLDTGRMRRSFALNVTSTGFTLWTKTKYAPHHQYGTKGHKAYTRFQAVGGNSRFIAHSSSRQRGKGVVHLYANVRALPFQEGGGKIPRRMMIPDRAMGFGTWGQPMKAAATRFISRILRGK